MGDYKFDTFYYSVDNSSEHYLSEIEDLSDEDFRSLYKGKMYCPLCRKPQLSLVKRDGCSFLRTYPNQVHVSVDGKICSYAYDTVSPKMMEKYIQELREKKKIKSLLESVMRELFKQDNSERESLKDTENQAADPLLIQQVKNGKIIKKTIIPHYSFKSWGKNIPQDQLLIVYGKVYIELKEIPIIDKEGNRVTQTYIHFKDIKSKKLITSCRKPEQLDVNEGDYYAVVLGRCHSKTTDKGYTYYNIGVNFPVVQSILLKSFSPCGIT